MAKIVLFGIRDVAEIAHYYLTNDSAHEIVAFCVTKEFLPKDKYFKSLPIVDFDDVDKQYPNNEYSFFAPMTPSKMNTLREEIYYKIKDKGYDLISYVSTKASINNAEIGENCFIQEGNTLQPFSKIGNNVMIWSDNLVGHHCIVKDHVTITSHVVIAGNCIIGENSFLGLNATIRNEIILNKGTLVGMGTVISNNTEEWSVCIGNPAKKIGKNISKSILQIRKL